MSYYWNGPSPTEMGRRCRRRQSHLLSLWFLLLSLSHLTNPCQSFSLLPNKKSIFRWNKESSKKTGYYSQTTDQDGAHENGLLFEIEFVPSVVELQNVSVQYPVTLARRLFSSVPRRDYAVNNVSAKFTSEIVLLQGASSSGKSALMKIIVGGKDQNAKVTGKAKIVVDNPDTLQPNPSSSSAIYLADKPPYNNYNTVESLLTKEATKLCNERDDPLPPEASVALASTICQLVNLEISEKKVAELTPSENYRVQLAKACLQSSLPGLVSDGKRLILPAPIVCLDEWLDFETSDVSRKVEEALLHLATETGAVVFCATHKPNLWPLLTKITPQTSQMTMCRGEILTLQQSSSKDTLA